MKFNLKEILTKTKKGFIDMQQGVMLVLSLVVIAIVGSIGASILATNQAAQKTCVGVTSCVAGVNDTSTVASNITGYGLTGINSFASQLSNVGLVGGLALILIVLFGGLYFLFGQQKR